MIAAVQVVISFNKHRDTRLKRLILNGWVYFGLIDLPRIAAIDFFHGFLLKVYTKYCIHFRKPL